MTLECIASDLLTGPTGQEGPLPGARAVTTGAAAIGCRSMGPTYTRTAPEASRYVAPRVVGWGVGAPRILRAGPSSGQESSSSSATSAGWSASAMAALSIEMDSTGVGSTPYSAAR